MFLNKNLVFEIVYEPNLILSCVSKNVDIINNKIITFSKKLYDTMKFYNAVGLASTQVGVLKKIITLNTSILNPYLTKKIEDNILINAKITKYSKDKFEFDEGCLSFGQFSITTQRYKIVHVEYKNIKGETKKIQATQTLLCACLQHEIDHTNGILFYQRIPDVYKKKQMYIEYINNKKLYYLNNMNTISQK